MRSIVEMKLRQRLAEAEAAYYAIISGNAVRTLVDQNGERIEYGPANASRLLTYIENLKMQLGLKGTIGRPMRVWF